MENGINERIDHLIRALKMSNNAFAKSIGKSASAINFMVEGRSKPSYDVLESICEQYPDINHSWLLVGEGEMWKNKVAVKTNSDAYLQEYLTKLEEKFERVLNQLEKKDHQLETKDSQIQSLQEMLKMTLGKHRLGERITCQEYDLLYRQAA